MKTKTALMIPALCLAAPFTFAQTHPLKILWQQTVAHPGGAFSVQFSPDGQQLASGGAYIVQSGAQLFYGQVKTWTAQNGTPIASTPQDQSIGGVNEVSYSPDGAKIAAGDGAVYCSPDGGCGSTAPAVSDYGAADLLRLRLQSTNPINATIDYSPDGSLLATGEYYTDHMIRIRSAADLSVIRSLPGHIEAPNDFGTFSVRFSPDGTLLASGGADGNVKIWRVSDGALLKTLVLGSELTPNVFTVAFSPDGQDRKSVV